MANKLEGFLVGAIQAAFEDLDVYCRASLKSSKEAFHLTHELDWNALNEGQLGLVVLEIGEVGIGYLTLPVRAFICLAGSMMLLPKERISEMMNKLEVDEECQLTIHEVGNLVAGTLGRFGREHHGLEHSIRLKLVLLKPETPFQPEAEGELFAYEFELRTDRSEPFAGHLVLPRSLVETSFKADKLLEDLKAQAEAQAMAHNSDAGGTTSGAWQGGPPQGWQGGPPQGWQGGPPQGWQGGPPQGWQGGPPQGWQGGPPQGWQGGPPQGWQGGPPQGWQGGPPQGWQGGPPQGWQGGPPQGWQGGPPQGWQGGPPQGWQGGPPQGWQGGPPQGWQGGPPQGWQGGSPQGWQGGPPQGWQQAGWQQAGWAQGGPSGPRSPMRGGESGAVSAGRAALLTALSEPELPRAAAQVQLNGIQVLIVDASWVARRTLAKILIPHGCVVSDGKDSVTARGLLARRSFDVMLLDINLQGESGLDFCRTLRAEGLTERMAVVMTSSGSTPDHVVQSIHAGASFFLVKPIGEQYLVRVLSGVLRQYRNSSLKSAAG